MLNKKGSSTIEATLGILLVMIVILAVANFIAISFEKNTLSQKIEVLGVKASLTGGLLNDEKNAFLDELELMGYDTANTKITIRRVVNGEESTSDIFLFDSNSDNYVKISDINNQLHFKIIIPYKDKTIFYSLFSDLEFMTFERRFVSRRT